jgi:hypothetical protein
MTDLGAIIGAGIVSIAIPIIYWNFVAIYVEKIWLKILITGLLSAGSLLLVL